MWEGERLAAAMVIFVAIAVAIASANMITHLAAVVIAADPTLATALGVQVGGSPHVHARRGDLRAIALHAESNHDLVQCGPDRAMGHGAEKHVIEVLAVSPRGLQVQLV